MFELFIPELTTRITVKTNIDELDDAINLLTNDEILGDIPSLVGLVEDKKSQLQALQEPVGEAIAETLSSFQESIISSKHYKTGMMSNSSDISRDGSDWLVGNTASSVDGFPYPLAIEKGTRDHWIAPVTFSALHWTDSTGEHWSKGHMVSGIEADPFVQASIDDTMDAIDYVIEDFLGGL